MRPRFFFSSSRRRSESNRFVHFRDATFIVSMIVNTTVDLRCFLNCWEISLINRRFSSFVIIYFSFKRRKQFFATREIFLLHTQGQSIDNSCRWMKNWETKRKKKWREFNSSSSFLSSFECEICWIFWLKAMWILWLRENFILCIFKNSPRWSFSLE